MRPYSMCWCFATGRLTAAFAELRTMADAGTIARVYLDMFGHVFGHLFGHVCGSVFRHVFGHVFKRVFRHVFGRVFRLVY